MVHFSQQQPDWVLCHIHTGRAQVLGASNGSLCPCSTSLCHMSIPYLAVSVLEWQLAILWVAGTCALTDQLWTHCLSHQWEWHVARRVGELSEVYSSLVEMHLQKHDASLNKPKYLIMASCMSDMFFVHMWHVTYFNCVCSQLIGSPTVLPVAIQAHWLC